MAKRQAIRVTVNVDGDVASKMDDLVEKKVFRNRSHAYEVAAENLVKQES